MLAGSTDCLVLDYMPAYREMLMESMITRGSYGSTRVKTSAANT